MKYYVQNWEKAYDHTYRLAEQIIASGFKPDVVVGVARGGWIPARLLADFLKLKQTVNVKIETYQMMAQEELLPNIQQPLSGSVKDKKILLVDDVADSGTTLKATIDLIHQGEASEVRTAVLYFKPRCIVNPDYYAIQTEAWILFSWSIFESIQEFETNWEKEGMSRGQIMERLKSIGLSPLVINSYFEIHKK